MKRHATESTTAFLRRRVRHWKTTLAGIATIAGPILMALFPKWTLQISLVTATLTGSGLIAAADAKPLPETKP
jgi:hypothetical protein